MSQPRRVVPGASYSITRRCAQRAFRLLPSEEINQALQYVLALAAAKTGVVLHAVCMMSNHHHMVVTDVLGALPNFLREFHRAAAKVLNACQGQRENLWSAEAPSVVCLGDDEDVIRKMTYVVANPVDAGLVAHPEEWPGVILWGNRSVDVRRPLHYFAANGTAPLMIQLRTEAPRHARSGLHFDPVRLARAIEARVADAHRAMKAAGKKFLGRAGVLAKSFAERAKSLEEKNAIVPTIAAIDPVVREGLVRTRQSFLVAYYEALRQWCEGKRDVCFPRGTWWMRVHHGAKTTAAGPGVPIAASA